MHIIQGRDITPHAPSMLQDYGDVPKCATWITPRSLGRPRVLPKEMLIATGLLAGRLFDRVYLYYQLYGGALLLSFSLFMLSLAKPDQYYQIMLSQGVGAGLGEGLIYIPSVAIISQYFKQRRALTMTIVASGSSLGSIVHTIMLNNNMNNPRLGFAIGARANAGLVSGLLLIACLLMRTRTKPQPHPVNMWTAARRFSKDGPYVLTAVGMSLFAVGFYFPLFYIQQDALTHGLNKTISFYSLVILDACSFIGRRAPGFFANRVGVYNITATVTFSCAVFILGMIGISSEGSVIVVAIIYGLFAGTYIAMLAPMLSHLMDIAAFKALVAGAKSRNRRNAPLTRPSGARRRRTSIAHSILHEFTYSFQIRDLLNDAQGTV